MAIIRNQPIFFARQSYKTKASQLSPQKLINMYAESVPSDVKGQTKYILYNSHGLKQWVNVSADNPVYALRSVGNVLFAVIGVDVYAIEPNKNYVNIGSLTNSVAGRVKTSANSTQLTITDAVGNGYIAIYDPDTNIGSVTPITDPDYEPAVDCCFIDQYTIYALLNSQIYKISATDDSSDIEVDFGSAESEPDNLIGCEKFNGQLWLFGSKSIEVHQNTGNQDFPFERISGAILDKGCVATESIARNANNLCWLGNDRIIYRAEGYNYNPISTYAINQQLVKLQRVDNAFAFIYVQDGHQFYAITFPTDKITIELDLGEELWHDRQSFNENMELGQWRANCHEFFNGFNLVGDFENGIIYQIDSDTFMEGDNKMISQIDSKIISGSTGRFNLLRLELDIESGVGITTGQGSDPLAMLQISVNGGKTHGAEMWRKMGAQGEYFARPEWRQLGVVEIKGMNFRWKVSDPVRRAIFGAFIDYEELKG